MRSIRQRLLQALLIGVVLISSITGWLIHRHVRIELEELYNAHMQQVAMVLAEEFDRVDVDKLEPMPPTHTDRDVWEEQDYLIQAWSKDGRLISAQFPTSKVLPIPLQNRTGFSVGHIDHVRWRFYRADSAEIIVQIAQPDSARSAEIRETSATLWAPLLLQIPLLALLALISVKRALLPLDELSRAVAQRRPDALGPLDTTTQPAELVPLIQTLNDLLKRLEQAMKQQRYFVADAAHELRTPIATLQLQLDLLRRASSPDDHVKSVAALSGGIQRATHLIQQLLSIARAESPSPNKNEKINDMTIVAEASLQRHLPLAAERHIDLGVTQFENAQVCCPSADLEAVMDNLICNAVRYTPPGGKVDIAVHRTKTHAIFEVSDNGPGIPVAERGRIFDRFYRIPKLSPPSSHLEGSGLGLAIVKTICDCHGASVTVGDNATGQGARFTIKWPLALS